MQFLSEGRLGRMSGVGVNAGPRHGLGHWEYRDMARAEGFYWARKYEDGSTVIAALRDGEWTIGDGEYYDEDDEEGLMVVAGPLQPPAADVVATWKERYDKTLKSFKKAKGKNALQGWDYLEGYYWVRVPGNPEPVLAQYFEGWGEAAGEQDFDEDVAVEILDGPLVPPRLARTQEA